MSSKKYNFTANRKANLIKLLAEGNKIDKVCETLGLNKTTFYNHYKDDLDFRAKVDEARAQCEKDIDESAKLNVKKAIDDGDLETSKWWLNHKKKFGAIPTTDTVKPDNDNSIITPDGIL